MHKTIGAFSRKTILGCLFAFFAATCAWAADSININLCQGTDNSFKVSSTVSTLIGDIPAAAWAQSTTAGNGTITTTTGFDGTSTITLSSAVSIQENVDKMGNHGQDTSYSHQVLKSWLATKDNTSHPGTLTISNIPFTFYDVIVIMSGATGTTGGFSGNFAPLTITAENKSATKYAGGTDAENYNTVVTDSDSGWGSRGQNTITYGTNALRVDGLAGTLTISYTAYAEGIAGVQIIDSTAEHFVEQYALTHNDGYVRDGVTYNYIFRGTDSTYPTNWGTCANWYTRVAPNTDLDIAEEFWSPYTSFSSVSSKNAPLVGTYSSNSYAGTGDDRKNESPYDPALVDGALIDNFDPDTPITMSFCEGWEVKMGVYGGAKVEVNRINKLQSDEGTKWFRVGEGSKITIKAMGTGTVNNDIKFYVAEPAGFEWKCTLNNNSDGGTFKYYLSGDGSVKYAAGLNRGTHRVRSYTGALSEPGDYKKIVVKTLIAMGEGTQKTKTVSFTDATVTFGDVAGTAVSGLTLSDDVGSYEFSQDDSGAYISYVDYSNEDMGLNVEPDGTLVISEAVADNRKVICDGSFTITGTSDYTVTSADLAKLDFSDVTGTVTLGAYTCYALGTSRTLPSGLPFVFGTGSAVSMTEMAQEATSGSFAVYDLVGVSYIVLTRQNETIDTLTVKNVSRTLAENSNGSWSDAAWTIDGMPSSSLVLASGYVYDVKIEVSGDCTFAVPNNLTDAGCCNVRFVSAIGAESAVVTLVCQGIELPDSPSTTADVSSILGAATVSASSGAALSMDGSGTAKYAIKPIGASMYAAMRPSVGVVSVRIGARTQRASGGYIDPTYSAVGPYPMSGMFWNQTKFWNDNSTTGNYTDIQNLTDAKDDSSAVRIGYYGHNTYFNTDKGNAADSPNKVLTATYLDDSTSGNGNLTATASADGETIQLPTPGHTRGWQLHFENIPYNAYDVYFVTASDVDSGLKECPIYVSLDGGTTWKSYCGDSVNEKTVMGTDNWTGLHYAVDGNLVHGKNYIKMRITKSIYGDNISTIDITHGRRDTGAKVRSGLAAIQIVEVENDGVYTLAESGNWSDAVWNTGALTGQTWADAVDGEPSIAKIASSVTLDSVTVDMPVSAGSVVLTGSDPFTVAGSSNLTVETGFDASAFTGSLTLQAPISGTIYIGTNTDLQFGGDDDMTLPAYTLDGAGAWSKVGAGTLTVANSIPIAGEVTAGVLEITASYSGNLLLNGGDLVFAGGESEVIYDGSATLADNAEGKTTIASGVVQSRGSIATDIDVDAGAVLKLGSVGGFGATGGGTTPSGKAITVTGTVELNGVRDSCNAYTLNGGTLRNTGAAVPTDNRQTTALTLTTNSTVHAGSDFGLVGSGYAATSLELGGWTLAKTGDASFWLYNTRSTGTGTIDIQAGSVYAYSTVSMSNVDFNIADGATLKIRTDDFSVGTISGTGTINFGQNRPTTALNFAEGSSLDVKIVLASTTEASVRIPYTGSNPNSVTVYEPSGDWDVESTAATVSYEAGYIVIAVDVADTRRDNPALDGDQATFTNVFMGDADTTWGTTANWKVSSNNRWADYSRDLAPNLSNSEEWGSILFDGNIMKTAVDADGYKSVTAETLEGWGLQVGIINGARVTIQSTKKHQNGCWYWVDATSKLILGSKASGGNNGGTLKFYVAAKDGVEFLTDYDLNGCTVQYSLKGDGSIKYNTPATKGTLQIKRVSALPLGKVSPVKRIFRHTLVSLGGASSAFDTSSTTVAGLKVNKAGAEEAVTMTLKTSGEGEDVAILNAATDPVGTYVFVQDATGVYIDYVGYSVPLSIRLR